MKKTKKVRIRKAEENMKAAEEKVFSKYLNITDAQFLLDIEEHAKKLKEATKNTEDKVTPHFYVVEPNL